MTDTRCYRFLDEVGYHIPSDETLAGWLPTEPLLFARSEAQVAVEPAARAPALRIRRGWLLRVRLSLDPSAIRIDADRDRTC